MPQAPNAQQDQAFLIHQRAYRESSAILYLLTENHGLLHVIAKGAKRKRSPWRSCLMPFQQLAIHWMGRGELGTLTHMEPEGGYHDLKGLPLYSAWYLHECLMRLCHPLDPHPRLFQAYHNCLSELMTQPCDLALRRFERCLLDEMGYGLPWHHVQPGLSEAYYFHIEEGFVPCQLAHPQACSTSILQAIDQGHWTPEARKHAKIIFRQAIDARLNRPLKTRAILSCLLASS